MVQPQRTLSPNCVLVRWSSNSFVVAERSRRWPDIYEICVMVCVRYAELVLSLMPCRGTVLIVFDRRYSAIMTPQCRWHGYAPKNQPKSGQRLHNDGAEVKAHGVKFFEIEQIGPEAKRDRFSFVRICFNWKTYENMFAINAYDYRTSVVKWMQS